MITGELSTESFQLQPTIPFREPREWPRSDSPRNSKRFGGFVIHERLGAGGMAQVHRAELQGPHGFRKTVALKRLLPHAAVDEDLVKLFLDEARLASRLRHPNIAGVYDFGQVSGQHYMTMELVRGPTLKELIVHCQDTVGLIPFPVVVHLLCEICDALAYAHDQVDEYGVPLGIIHRDVSPSNVIVSKDGFAKLIDFGVAKTVGTHTSTGIIKGKLAYVAPEYLDGKLDRRADLWGLGVLAWELLTNRRLFDGDDVMCVQRVHDMPIDPPSHHNPDVPRDLDVIVMTALERDPAMRWQNAAAMRTALNDLPCASRADVVEWIDWAFAQTQRAAAPVEKITVPERGRGLRARTVGRLQSLTEILLLKRKGPAVGAAMLARRTRDRHRGRVFAIAVIALIAGAVAAMFVPG
ncbi:MAG: serine/threonine protein kinase [Acidobacteriota bacterium]